MLEQLERMLAAGKESALLRFGLGNEHLKRGDPVAASAHFRRAIELDPKYSAAYKLLGKAYEDAGNFQAAIDAYRQGVAVADQNGDKQASKEMQVFLKRAEKKA